MEKATNQHQAILVYPKAKKGFWNDDLNKQVNIEWQFDDVKFIEKMIDLMHAKHNIDSDKVFVIGMSNGGVMAIKLGLELSEKISGIAVVSAQMEFKRQYLQLNNPLSMILINGTVDAVFPYQGGQLKPFKSIKNKGKVLSTQQTIDYFVKNNGCQEKSVIKEMDDNTMDMTKIVSNIYEGCQQGKLVKLMKVIGGGHTWPGGKQYLPASLIGPMSKEINASQVILDFFLGTHQ